MIDKAVATWDPAFHEPPAVVGHPRDDAPAYGLVSAVKAEEHGGKKILLAKFRDVEPQFADLVKAGRFPSAAPASTRTGACGTWDFWAPRRRP